MATAQPVFLMAGGDFRKESEMIQRIKGILATTGKDNPDVAYIGVASSDDHEFFNLTVEIIKKAGARSVKMVALADEEADLAKATSFLDTVDVVFMSGGDVEEGMHWINHHNLVPFFKKLYDKGTLFFGVSAGSIMLGSQWVCWEDPTDDSSASFFDCMGIVPLLCDTHAEQDTWEELQVAVTLMDEKGRGYGIPSGGTLVVQPDGKFIALDKSTVFYEKTATGAEKKGMIACGK